MVVKQWQQDCAYVAHPNTSVFRFGIIFQDASLYQRTASDLVITKSDKGNNIVVMDLSEYHTKLTRLVQDTAIYQHLPKDRSWATNASVKQLAKQLLEGENISKTQYARIYTSGPGPAQLFGTPKLHKQETPLRPVVDTNNTPTYGLASFLSKILNCLVPAFNRLVRNTDQFLTRLNNAHMSIPVGHSIFSVDVKSLFTNIPMDLAI